MPIPQPKCPITMPADFPLDVGSALVDPITGSRLSKADSYLTFNRCGDEDLLKFNSNITVIALDEETCEAVPTAYMTIKGAVPYCTTEEEELDKLINPIRAQIIIALGLTPA